MSSVCTNITQEPDFSEAYGEMDLTTDPHAVLVKQRSEVQCKRT